TVGSEASGVAYTLLVLALTNSPAKAGLVGFARLVPYALFALPAGVAVDRWNRKRLMIVSDVVRVLALGSLGVVVLSGDLSFVQVPIVAFVEGTMFVLFNIAEIGAVRSVVPAPQLLRAPVLDRQSALRRVRPDADRHGQAPGVPLRGDRRVDRDHRPALVARLDRSAALPPTPVDAHGDRRLLVARARDRRVRRVAER